MISEGVFGKRVQTLNYTGTYTHTRTHTHACSQLLCFKSVSAIFRDGNTFSQVPSPCLWVPSQLFACLCQLLVCLLVSKTYGLVVHVPTSVCVCADLFVCIVFFSAANATTRGAATVAKCQEDANRLANHCSGVKSSVYVSLPTHDKCACLLLFVRANKYIHCSAAQMNTDVLNLLVLVSMYGYAFGKA